MRTVTQPRPRINRDDEPVVVAIGTEHRDRGEPIPPRPRPFSPSQAEAEANAIAERAAGDTAGESRWPFKAGAYESLYGELHQHYLDALATIERMKPFYYPFDDELPDLAAEFVLARETNGLDGTRV
jgi:hypothetical protein